MKFALVAASIAAGPVLAAAAGHDPRDFDADPLLPGFHFVPWPSDWMNDPNGPMYDPVHDMYHLHYQYQTPRNWGHAVSKDLVNWQQLPQSLTRDHDYDAGGDFSGSATVLNDEQQTPVLTVSTNNNDMVFIAVPDDRDDPYLTNWSYVDYNPIYRTDARDPTEVFITSEGNYRIADGANGGTELFEAPAGIENFFSNETWEKIGMLHTGEGYWECPDFYQLLGDNATPDLWVSKYSQSGDYMFTGTYDEAAGKFTPTSACAATQPTMYDQNSAFYASKSFYDSRDVDNVRRILYGWLIMHTDDSSTWQSAQSVPRVIDADVDGCSVRTNPIPELESLRGDVVALDDALSLSGDDAHTLTGVNGTMLDIVAKVTVAKDAVCGLTVLGNFAIEVKYADVVGGDDDVVDVEVRVLVDNSLVEQYVSTEAGQQWVRTDYVDGGSSGLVAATSGATGACVFSQIDVFPMSPFDYDISLCEDEGCL